MVEYASRRLGHPREDPVLYLVVVLAGLFARFAVYAEFVSLDLFPLAIAAYVYLGFKFGVAGSLVAALVDLLGVVFIASALGGDIGLLFSDADDLSEELPISLSRQQWYYSALLGMIAVASARLSSWVESQVARAGLKMEDLFPWDARFLTGRANATIKRWASTAATAEDDQIVDVSAEANVGSGTPSFRFKVVLKNAALLLLVALVLVVSLGLTQSIYPSDSLWISLRTGPAFTGLVMLLAVAFHRGWRSVDGLMWLLFLPASVLALSFVQAAESDSLSIEPDLLGPGTILAASIAFWWLARVRTLMDRDDFRELTSSWLREPDSSRANLSPVKGGEVVLIGLLAASWIWYDGNVEIAVSLWLGQFTYMVWLSHKRLTQQLSNIVFAIYIAIGTIQIWFDLPFALGDWSATVELYGATAVHALLIAAVPPLARRFRIESLQDARTLVFAFIGVSLLADGLNSDTLARHFVFRLEFWSGIDLPLSLCLQAAIGEAAARWIFAHATGPMSAQGESTGASAVGGEAPSTQPGGDAS